MSRGQKKSRGLFHEASRLLKQVRPESPELFVCPLCLWEFPIAATTDGRLSVEHVIPSALGGEVETLTCTECNNTQGSTLDSHVVKAMEALDGFSGKGTVRGIFHNDVGHVAVNFAFRTGAKTDPNVIRIVGEASKSGDTDRAVDGGVGRSRITRRASSRPILAPSTRLQQSGSNAFLNWSNAPNFQ